MSRLEETIWIVAWAAVGGFIGVTIYQIIRERRREKLRAAVKKAYDEVLKPEFDEIHATFKKINATLDRTEGKK
jgi:Na+-translocating ferredoxin:NAD+ oxidoreductase RnfG subunit